MNWHRVNVKDTIPFNMSDEQFNTYLNKMLPHEIKKGDLFIPINFKLGKDIKYIIAKDITEKTINGFLKISCVKVDKNGEII